MEGLATEDLATLPLGSRCTLLRGAVRGDAAAAAFSTLASELPWTTETDEFGLHDRKTAYFGDADCVFAFCGLALSPRPWTPALLRLRALVEEACGLAPGALTACLANNYPDGEGHIPWHHDEVRAHGQLRAVASLSLGAPRLFRIRRRPGAALAAAEGEREVLCEVEVRPGDVVLMSGGTQELLEHQLPLRPSDGHRISLTFRSIVPGWEGRRAAAGGEGGEEGGGEGNGGGTGGGEAKPEGGGGIADEPPSLVLSELRLERPLLADSRSSVLLCSRAGEAVVLKLTRRAADGTRFGGRRCASSAERAAREAKLLASSALRGAPFVVRSRGWLCGERLFALLLDYLPGGSLGALLRRTGPLGQRAARFYVGQAALGLAHLHERRVGHRDLKPDNLCLSSAGHCTLVDFGFARSFGRGAGEGEGEGEGEGQGQGQGQGEGEGQGQGQGQGQGEGEGEGEGRSFSLLGTPDYLAPEMFLREGHGPRVDLWALGATLYELLLDALPFGSGGDPTATYAAALRGAPHFPASPFLFCAAAKDLVMALLSRDPTARPSPSTLLQHPFFGAGAFPKADAMDAASLAAGRLPPPLVPRLRSALDAAYFEADDEEEDDSARTASETELEAGSGAEPPSLEEARETLCAHQPARGDGEIIRDTSRPG